MSDKTKDDYSSSGKPHHGLEQEKYSFVGQGGTGHITVSERTSLAVNSIQDLAVSIREARKCAGMTQQELADLAGVGPRFLNELERGKKETLEFGKVLKVCKAAGVRITVNM